MILRFLSTLTATFILACISQAQIHVESAYYGRPGKSEEVTETIRTYVKRGQLSFRVNPISMGRNPNPGKENYFRVEYTLHGRKITGTANDGDVFVFQGAGLSGGQQSRGEASLKVVNNLGQSIRIYSVDGYGRWHWGEQLRPGGVFTTYSDIGHRWVVTSLSSARIIYEFRARRGDNRIAIDNAAVGGLDVDTRPSGGGELRLRFENNYGRSLYLYQLNRWGAWDWKAQLEPDGVYAANAEIGETWIATDRSGRVIEKIVVGRGMSQVRIGR
jgi:hypothetical protein